MSEAAGSSPGTSFLLKPLQGWLVILRPLRKKGLDSGFFFPRRPLTEAIQSI